MNDVFKRTKKERTGGIWALKNDKYPYTRAQRRVTGKLIKQGRLLLDKDALPTVAFMWNHNQKRR